MKRVIFLIIVILESASTELSNGDRDTINKGLAAAKDLSDFLQKADFAQSLTKLATTLSPYLSAIGPVVGLLLGFLGSQDSAELAFMKQMMTHIDTRFDQLDGKFDEINRKIDYVHIQIQFGTIAQKIQALSAKFEAIYNSPPAAFQQLIEDFIMNYESDYQLSGQKLYDGIMNEKNVFSQSLGEAAMEYSKNDRASVQHFMTGVLKLLLQAVKLELAYQKAKNHDYLYESVKNDWITKINNVKTKMMSIDNIVASRYLTQADTDIVQFAVDNSNLNNADYSDHLYKFLTTKYYWRDWLVLTYKPISGFQNHRLHECNGFLKLREHGHNILVSSVDKTKPPLDITLANSVLMQLTSKSPLFRFLPADKVFDLFPSEIRTSCSPYASEAVVRSGSDQHYQSPHNRLVIIDTGIYSIHLFG